MNKKCRQRVRDQLRSGTQVSPRTLVRFAARLKPGSRNDGALWHHLLMPSEEPSVLRRIAEVAGPRTMAGRIARFQFDRLNKSAA